MDEAELIAKIKLGDMSAASALISLLAAGLDEYSRKIGGDLGDFEREQAVDKAMARLVERIDQYDPTKASLHTWARGFVRNELKELRRSVREIATEAGGLDSAVTDPDPLTDDEPPPSAETTAMAALVLSLSEADQTLIRLRVMEKLDFEAIAQCFDPPVRADAMRKRWERIRTKIARLAGEDPDLKRYTTEEEEKK